MKKPSSALLIVSTIIFLLASCGKVPLNPVPVSPPSNDSLKPAQVATPLPVKVDGSSLLAPLPQEKIISFGPIIPIGIATDTRDGIGITFYGSDGIVLGEVRAAPLAGSFPAMIHIGGSYTWTLDFPVVFLSGENSPFSLEVSQNGQTSPLIDVQNLSGMTGVPGQPLLAYASLEPQDSGALRSRVFLGDLASLTNLAPILVFESTDSLAVVPAKIRIQDGVATGLWYSLRPQGIGGDIVFDPLAGLYFLDLKDKAVYQVLPKDATFSDISQSQTRVVYSIRQAGRSILNLRNLGTSQVISLPSLPESERGSGAAIFSPDEQVVWMEARGSLLDGNLFSTIRVANSEGRVLFDYPQTQFYKAAGLGDQISIKPVGWLDEQTFIVQVTAHGKSGDSTIVRVNMASGVIASMAPGTFVGFVHHP
jgi:hypothetical protein